VPYLRATLTYARPLLAADEEAAQLYQAALSSDMSKWPCYRGRLLLNYGSWLRQQRGVAESRAPLRTALESFDALALTVGSLPGQDRVLPANQRGRVVR
jgi:Tfp pilus assembly protein PilF